MHCVMRENPKKVRTELRRFSDIDMKKIPGGFQRGWFFEGFYSKALSTPQDGERLAPRSPRAFSASVSSGTFR